jgi:hypothetical protein
MHCISEDIYRQTAAYVRGQQLTPSDLFPVLITLAHWLVEQDTSNFKPTPGRDAASPEAFELLRFAVNGEDRPIRRTTRKQAQTYTASVGHQHLAAGQPVNITYTYRTITTQAGHLLFFDIEQPTRDLHLDFDYTTCPIQNVSTLDLVPSVRPTRIENAPAKTSSNVIRVDLDGWIFPRSGIAFVWTLESEVQASPKAGVKTSHDAVRATQGTSNWRWKG